MKRLALFGLLLCVVQIPAAQEVERFLIVPAKLLQDAGALIDQQRQEIERLKAELEKLKRCREVPA